MQGVLQPPTVQVITGLVSSQYNSYDGNSTKSCPVFPGVIGLLTMAQIVRTIKSPTMLEDYENEIDSNGPALI